MKCVLLTAPVIEPITLDELKLHLRLDSGSFAENINEAQSIYSGSYGIDYELMTLDVAPGGSGWSAADTITGMSSTKTCVIVTVITTKTYIVRSRSGAFTLGEVLTNGVDTADQGASYPTFATGYRILGEAVEVLGYDPVVVLSAGTVQATGTLNVKIQESDDSILWIDWTGGAFTQVTPSNDNTNYEIPYTGVRRYIRTVAYVATAAAEFSTYVIRQSPQVAEDDLLTDLIATARKHVEEITGRALLTQTWEYYLQEWPRKNYIKLPYGYLQSVAGFKYIESDGTEIILKDETISIAFDTHAIAGDYTTHVGASVYVYGYDAFVTLTSGTNGASGTVDVKIQESDDDISWSDWTDGAFTQVTTTNDNTTYTMSYTGDKPYIRVVAMVLVAACEFGATITISTEDETFDYIVETNGTQCGRIVLPFGDTWPGVTLYPSNGIVIRFICGLTLASLIPRPVRTAIKMICAKLYEGRGEDVIGQSLAEDKFFDRLLSTSRLYDKF